MGSQKESELELPQLAAQNRPILMRKEPTGTNGRTGESGHGHFSRRALSLFDTGEELSISFGLAHRKASMQVIHLGPRSFTTVLVIFLEKI